MKATIHIARTIDADLTREQQQQERKIAARKIDAWDKGFGKDSRERLRNFLANEKNLIVRTSKRDEKGHIVRRRPTGKEVEQIMRAISPYFKR